MSSILHSTGVCIECHSDFSGLKSKKHGICHRGKAFLKDFLGSSCVKNEYYFVVTLVTFYVSGIDYMIHATVCTSTERSVLVLTCSATAAQQPHSDCT